MSARAVLSAAYTHLARRADNTDEMQRLGGKDATAREDLDKALGLDQFDDEDDGFVGDQGATTNVVELHAWVARVNTTMR